MDYGIDFSKKEITKEDYKKIIIETTKIIEAKQDAKEVAIAFYDRAWVYIKMYEYDKAIYDCTSAIKIAPEFASAYFNRGLSQWKMNRLDKALDNFNNALRFYTENNGNHKQIEDTKSWIEKIEEKILN